MVCPEPSVARGEQEHEDNKLQDALGEDVTPH